jgi:hypothetical protein
MTDGSVYHIYKKRDQYEKEWDRIEFEELKDPITIELEYQNDLGIITDEEYRKLDKERNLVLEKELKDKELRRAKAIEIRNSIPKEDYQLLKEFSNLL